MKGGWSSFQEKVGSSIGKICQALGISQINDN